MVLGEDLTDTYIIANDRVECLLIPRSQFVKKGNNKILDKLRDDLNDYIPSNEQAFQTYISDNKWNTLGYLISVSIRLVFCDIFGKRYAYYSPFEHRYAYLVPKKSVMLSYCSNWH